MKEVNENAGYLFNESYKKTAVQHPKSAFFLDHYLDKDFDSLVESLLVDTPKEEPIIRLKSVLVKILEKLELKTFILSIYDHYLILYDFFYRKTHRNPKVVGIIETLEYINKSHCSVVRYGDGEFKFVFGLIKEARYAFIT